MVHWSNQCMGGAVAAVLAFGAAPAVAQEGPPEDRISGAVGVDLATHFVSYGFDVWARGDDFGDDPSVFIWGELSWDLDPFSITGGVWSDINDNVESEIGGQIQEIDVYIGVGYTWEKLSFGATYQEWYYAGITEHILDLSVGFDDTGLIFDEFAFNPSVVYHNRIGGEGLEEGAALVLGVEPSFTILDSETYPVSLSIPVGVAFGLTGVDGNDDLYAETGFAYGYVGATVGVPLAFIPAEYGDWAAAANLTYYFTDDDAITTNPEDDFLTGMLSLSLSF